jgi:DNA invertase Pin-like site-specific DNA recombinase
MKRSRKTHDSNPTADPVRTAILITRVSSPNQAENDEGSLKNQLQRLRAYMNYRRASGEDWREATVIELRAISGKDSVRSPEFQPVFEQVRYGLVNTVLCTAQGNRISAE